MYQIRSSIIQCNRTNHWYRCNDTFENIITSNQSNKYNLIKNHRQRKGEIDWVMDLGTIRHLPVSSDDSTLSNKLDMMFTEVFNIMDETKTQIAMIIQSHDLGITGFENTYYGNIKLYDIGDTNTMSEYGLINFREMYKRNKDDFLI